MNFFGQVYEIVKQIPCGKVASYGQIARLAGNPRASRAVGYALHVNPQPGVVPCHRVVNRQGRLAPAFAFGGTDAQKGLLNAEGVYVNDDGYVDMKQFGWQACQPRGHKGKP
ncbi:MAG: MGMT family protein [Christensenella sp.]|nr:MGMT family protein [Christensenella sp.]MEA5004770.1 MGMT family protein [Christensenella sp.]